VLKSDKLKKIITLLADGEFHSGTELAERLGISRSAVSKQLSVLPDLGLQYSAISGRGYRLHSPIELLDSLVINQYLSEATQQLITSLEIFDQLDSTNRYLNEQAQHQGNSGVICLAEHQTAGKGRRGRQWVSPFGSNIYLSVLWRFQKGYSSISGLSLAIGVAVIRALKQLNIQSVSLKWPNDIYSNGKKLGGILIEISGETEGPCYAVIGLGLNLFLPDEQAAGITQEWTDLSKLLGKNFTGRNQLVAYLLEHILNLLTDYEAVGLTHYIDEWRQYDCLVDHPAQLFFETHTITGIIAGIDNNGLLMVKQPDNSIRSFASGEVSFHSTPL